MAFQSMAQVNEEKYGNRFRLANDGDYADVVFLYRDINDVLVGDVHYLKYPEFSGYVHCLGRQNCPACDNNNRIQRRIFIPLYLIEEDRVVFWDRTTHIENQLQRDVFAHYPNPSEVVFRITRRGAYRDIDTVYTIDAIAKNTTHSFNDICSKFNIEFPKFYDTICTEKTFGDLQTLINTPSKNSGVSPYPDSYELPEYQVSPRNIVDDAAVETVKELPDAVVTADSDVDLPDSGEDIPF